MPGVTFLHGLEIVRAQSWSPREFAIFGSGPLAIRGLRTANDVDVVAARALWSVLAGEHEVGTHRPGVNVIHIGSVEVLNAWWPDVGTPEAIIGTAEIIDGLPFVALPLVRRWKVKSARPKDLADLELIDAAMAGHGPDIRWSQ